MVTYSRLLLGTSALFLGVAFAVRRAELRPRDVGVLLVLLFATRASFLAVRPVGSEDLYRYLWDGKVQSAGINPYRFHTNSPELTPLHGDIHARLPQREDIKTPYFPFAQLVFLMAYELSGEAVWGIKLLLLLAEVSAVCGVLLLLRELRRPAALVLVYAAAPMAIVQFGLDGHVDVLGFPFLVFGLWLVLRGRLVAGWNPLHPVDVGEARGRRRPAVRVPARANVAKAVGRLAGAASRPLCRNSSRTSSRLMCSTA